MELHRCAACALGEACAECGIVDETDDLSCERGGVADGKEQAIGPVGQGASQRADVGGNGGRAAGEALQQRVGEVFEPERWDHGAQSALIERRQRGWIDMAFELHLPA
jgi:hypothetical protein